MPVALSLHAVTREFAGRRVLGPLSLHLAAGTTTVLTGPNGSGKTTLLRLAASLLEPTTGRVTTVGRALYLGPGRGLRPVERVGPGVRDLAVLAGAGRPGAGEVAGLLERVGLPGVTARARAGTLSAGERARVTLALTLALPADVVLLDEPTAHLDTDGERTTREVVAELARRGAAVVVATHAPEALGPVAHAHLDLAAGALAVGTAA